MASVHRIILSSSQWVKVPQDADVNYFRVVKESELAATPVVSPKKRKTACYFINRNISKCVNYAVRVLSAASPFATRVLAIALRKDELKEGQ